jgi:hypothetical protein
LLPYICTSYHISNYLFWVGFFYVRGYICNGGKGKEKKAPYIFPIEGEKAAQFYNAGAPKEAWGKHKKLKLVTKN